MRRDFSIQTFTPEGKDSKTGVLSVTGNLTLSNADTIKKQMLASLKKLDEIHLEIKNPDDIDLSFIQIVFSIIALCKSENKKFTHTFFISQEQKLLIEHAGFLPFLNIAEKL